MVMKKKVAKAVKSKPATKKAAPAKEPKAPKVEPVPLEDVGLKAKDRENLEALCEEYIAASEVISSYTKDRTEIAGKIKAECKRLGLPESVFTDDFKLTLSKGETKTIQATLLLSLGVSNAIIEKATKKTPTERLTVSGPKEASGGGEE